MNVPDIPDDDMVEIGSPRATSSQQTNEIQTQHQSYGTEQGTGEARSSYSEFSTSSSVSVSLAV